MENFNPLIPLGLGLLVGAGFVIKALYLKSIVTPKVDLAHVITINSENNERIQKHFAYLDSYIEGKIKAPTNTILYSNQNLMELVREASLTIHNELVATTYLWYGACAAGAGAAGFILIIVAMASQSEEEPLIKEGEQKGGIPSNKKT
jgi:hypothetical protein